MVTDFHLYLLLFKASNNKKMCYFLLDIKGDNNTV